MAENMPHAKIFGFFHKNKDLEEMLINLRTTRSRNERDLEAAANEIS